MQKGFRITALAGALSMALSGVATAANHDLTFGGWSVTGGQVDHTTADVCLNANYDCTVVAAGDGFKQIQVSPSATNTTTPSTDSYVMTVVTDQGANGSYGAGDLGFYDVSFVKMQMNLGGVQSNNVNGIFAEQSIAETTTTGTTGATSFDSSTNISTGWATATASPVTISQTLKDAGDTSLPGDDFMSGFMYESDNDPTTGTRTGFQMSIDQIAGLQSANQPASANDIQSFALRERQGTKMNGVAPGSIALGGGTMEWGANPSQTDDIKAIWLGQSINLDSVSQNANQGALGSSFGYLSFDNLADATPVISDFGFSASRANSAWEWGEVGGDPTTGPFNFNGLGTPCIADPTGTDQGACGPLYGTP